MIKTRFVLLDQGALRSVELENRIQSDDGAHFVVPDVAFSEMAIKRDPILSVKLSLELLKPVASRVHVSLSCGEIRELQREQPELLLPDILTEPGTQMLKTLLGDPAAPEYAVIIRKLQETAPEHRAIYDARQDKAVMIDHVAIFARNLKSAGLSALRAGKIDERQKLGMVLMIMEKMVDKTGAFPTDIDKRMLFVRLSRILLWAERQGLEGIKPEKVMNDFIDIDFVVAASYFDEIMTRDKTVEYLDRMMRNAMIQPYAESAIEAATAIGFKVSA